MAIQTYSNATYAVDVDWQDETIIKNLLKQGAFRIDFNTLYFTSSLNISTGSYCDVDGVIYYFDANTTVPTPAGNGTYYLYLDVSSAPTLVVNTTAPTYDPIRHGFYDGTTARALAQVSYTSPNFTSIYPLSSQIGTGILTAAEKVQTDWVETNDLTLNGLAVFNGQADFYDNIRFEDQVDFNATILDKNGNEVLSLQAESDSDSTNWGSGSSTYTVVTTHNFSKNVLGVAFITGFSWTNTYSRVQATNPYYKYTISGSTVSVTSLVSGVNTSETGNVAMYVTAFTE